MKKVSPTLEVVVEGLSLLLANVKATNPLPGANFNEGVIG
jgi:hypothetical protein